MKLHKFAAGARAFPSLHFRKGPGIEVDRTKNFKLCPVLWPLHITLWLCLGQQI